VLVLVFGAFALLPALWPRLILTADDVTVINARARTVTWDEIDRMKARSRPVTVNLVGGRNVQAPAGWPRRRSNAARGQAKRLTKASAVPATSRQPLSIVSACPRPAISASSVTPPLCCCFL
jgi:hypothetical protein